MRSCSELVGKFLETLNSYIRANGSRLLSIASIAEQSEVRLSTYGLMRYYTPIPDCPKFMDLLARLLDCGFEEYLSRYGFRIAGVEENEVYIKIPLTYVRGLVES